MVGLTGACSNRPTQLALAEANRVRAALVARAGRSAPKLIARRPDRATIAIATVLAMSESPLTILEILTRVEYQLGRAVNRGSLKAALSEFAASPTHAIQRVGRGRYESKPHCV